MRSNISTMRNCSAIIAPSSLSMLLRRNPVATICSCVAFGQQIAGNLLDDELVVRHVAIQRADHPFAPGPLVARHVLFVAVRVRIAGGIQPVPRPLLAKSLAGQQLLDRRFDPLLLEYIELLRRRRQADEIQVQPATQLVRIPEAPAQVAATAAGPRRTRQWGGSAPASATAACSGATNAQCAA